VARDFLFVAVYGPDGAFVEVRWPGSNKSIKVDGQEIDIDELIGATGMQLKVREKPAFYRFLCTPSFFLGFSRLFHRFKLPRHSGSRRPDRRIVAKRMESHC
jgi:hypothetical protein